MSLDLRALRYVVTVAEEGGFQRAAERLQMAQPPLSRRVADLERDLGVRLFERRPTRLTEAGEIFVESARTILGEVERLRDRMIQTGLGAAGRVRVGYVASVAYDTLPRLLEAMELRHPGIEVETHEGWSPELDLELREGRLDVVLSHSLPCRSEYAVQPLRVEPLMAVVGVNHPLADRKAVHLEELAGGDVIFLARRLAPTLYDTVLQALDSTGERFTLWESPLPGLRHHGFRRALDFTVITGSAETCAVAGTVALQLLGELPRLQLQMVWRTDNLAPSAALLLDTATRIANEHCWVSS